MKAGQKLFLLLFLLLSVLIFADSEFVFTFCGDIMSHSINLVPEDFKTPYMNIEKILKSDDLSFANLEFPINEVAEMSGYPRFNVHKEYVEAAIECGIEVFSLANNHVYDMGVEGIFQSLRSVRDLKEKYNDTVYFSGIRGNLIRDFTAANINLKGYRIGFLAVTQFLNRFEESPYVLKVNYKNSDERERFLAYVQKISSSYDIFILSYHGGIEYKRRPVKEKVAFFHSLVRAGVDIVYSHHPHTVQPYELVNYRGNKLILYSTGNLLSGMVGGGVGKGAIFRVKVVVKGHGNSASVDVRDVKCIPIETFKRNDGLVVIRLSQDSRKAEKNK